jgi:hypothetical protein
LGAKKKGTSVPFLLPMVCVRLLLKSMETAPQVLLHTCTSAHLPQTFYSNAVFTASYVLGTAKDRRQKPLEYRAPISTIRGFASLNLEPLAYKESIQTES